MRRELPLHAGVDWRCTGIHWIPESGAVSVGDAPVSIGYRNLARAGDSRVVSSLSAPVSIGDAPVSIGYRDMAWYSLEMHRYPLVTGIWSGICWRRAGIHWVPQSDGVSVRDAPVSIGYWNLAQAGDSC
jgi:hypothetical protein